MHKVWNESFFQRSVIIQLSNIEMQDWLNQKQECRRKTKLHYPLTVLCSSPSLTWNVCSKMVYMILPMPNDGSITLGTTSSTVGDKHRENMCYREASFMVKQVHENPFRVSTGLRQSHLLIRSRLLSLFSNTFEMEFWTFSSYSSSAG